MYYVEDMAMFAWRDLDPDYQTTGHSDVTDPWISKTGESVSLIPPGNLSLRPPFP